MAGVIDSKTSLTPVTDKNILKKTTSHVDNTINKEEPTKNRAYYSVEARIKLQVSRQD